MTERISHARTHRPCSDKAGCSTICFSCREGGESGARSSTVNLRRQDFDISLLLIFTAESRMDANECLIFFSRRSFWNGFGSQRHVPNIIFDIRWGLEIKVC